MARGDSSMVNSYRQELTTGGTHTANKGISARRKRIKRRKTHENRARNAKAQFQVLVFRIGVQ